MSKRSAKKEYEVRKVSNVPGIDAIEVRRISCEVPCDPRSVAREIREPGSVRGVVGDRLRAVLRARS